MSKILHGHVKPFTCFESLGGTKLSPPLINFCLWRLKMRSRLLSSSRCYGFIDVNPQNINSLLKLYQSSWCLVKYRISNNICFKHQLILRGNDKIASLSLPSKYKLYNKINRYRPNQWGENNLFEAGYEETLISTLKSHWIWGSSWNPNSFKTQQPTLGLWKEGISNSSTFPFSTIRKHKMNIVKSDRKSRRPQLEKGVGSIKRLVNIWREVPPTNPCLTQALMTSSSNSHPSHARPDYSLKNATMCYLQNMKASISVSDPIKQALGMLSKQSEKEALMII